MDIDHKIKLTDEQAAQVTGGFDAPDTFTQTKDRLLELLDATEAALKKLYTQAGLSLEELRNLFFIYTSYVRGAHNMNDFSIHGRATDAFRNCAAPFPNAQLRQDEVLNEVMNHLGILR